MTYRFGGDEPKKLSGETTPRETDLSTTLKKWGVRTGLGAIALLGLWEGGKELGSRSYNVPINQINVAAENLHKHFKGPGLITAASDNPGFETEKEPNYHGLADKLVEARNAFNEENGTETDQNLYILRSGVQATEVEQQNPLNWFGTPKTDSLEARLSKVRNLAMELKGLKPVIDEATGDIRVNSEGKHVYKINTDMNSTLYEVLNAVKEGDIFGTYEAPESHDLTDVRGNPVPHTMDDSIRKGTYLTLTEEK